MCSCACVRNSAVVWDVQYVFLCMCTEHCCCMGCAVCVLVHVDGHFEIMCCRSIQMDVFGSSKSRQIFKSIRCVTFQKRALFIKSENFLTAWAGPAPFNLLRRTHCFERDGKMIMDGGWEKAFMGCMNLQTRHLHRS